MLIGYFNKYKNYLGTIEYDIKRKIYYGEVIGLDKKHFASYDSEDFLTLENCFHKSVDEYIYLINVENCIKI